MSEKSPLLLLSSGARSRFLEDIVRALALPKGGHLQFRYEEKIIAKGVVASLSAASNELLGRTCYLAYLDNRIPGKKPGIVPVREARILEAERFGSSFIFKMEVGRYIRTHELSHLTQSIEASSMDALPNWKSDHEKHPKNPFDGYWVNFLTSHIPNERLVEHDSINGKHLQYFEESVNNLALHTLDFGADSQRFFFNIIGLKTSNNQVHPLTNGGWKLSPERSYKINIYHYFPDEGTHQQRPIHWLVCQAFGDKISLLEGGILRADSEYDFKTFTFLTIGSVSNTQNALKIFRTLSPADASASTAEINFNVEIASARIRNVVQALVIGSLIATTAIIANLKDITLLGALAIVVAGILAGFASVYKFSQTV